MEQINQITDIHQMIDDQNYDETPRSINSSMSEESDIEDAEKKIRKLLDKAIETELTDYANDPKRFSKN